MAEEVAIGFFEYWKAWLFLALLGFILVMGLGHRFLGWGKPKDEAPKPAAPQARPLAAQQQQYYPPSGSAGLGYTQQQRK